jgi:hypothetical protein
MPHIRDEESYDSPGAPVSNFPLGAARTCAAPAGWPFFGMVSMLCAQWRHTSR